ncbi:MAG: hypothetical protein KAS66_10740 [Candidatus Omnitrophica bacterium]|nr:hypothetical protein [Candidatus Omnitrophota bacterium]
MKIIKEKRNDTPGHLYRFVAISKIKNNTRRRFMLIATMPLFLIFNCLAMLPIISLTFIFNNIALFDTIIKRWNNPLE